MLILPRFVFISSVLGDMQSAVDPGSTHIKALLISNLAERETLRASQWEPSDNKRLTLLEADAHQAIAPTDPKVPADSCASTNTSHVCTPLLVVRGFQVCA